TGAAYRIASPIPLKQVIPKCSTHVVVRYKYIDISSGAGKKCRFHIAHIAAGSADIDMIFINNIVGIIQPAKSYTALRSYTSNAGSDQPGADIFLFLIP